MSSLSFSVADVSSTYLSGGSSSLIGGEWLGSWSFRCLPFLAKVFLHPGKRQGYLPSASGFSCSPILIFSKLSFILLMSNVFSTKFGFQFITSSVPWYIFTIILSLMISLLITYLTVRTLHEIVPVPNLPQFIPLKSVPLNQVFRNHRLKVWLESFQIAMMKGHDFRLQKVFLGRLLWESY